MFVWPFCSLVPSLCRRFSSFIFISVGSFQILLLIYATNYEYNMYKHKLYIIQLGANRSRLQNFI